MGLEGGLQSVLPARAPARLKSLLALLTLLAILPACQSKRSDAPLAADDPSGRPGDDVPAKIAGASNDAAGEEEEEEERGGLFGLFGKSKPSRKPGEAWAVRVASFRGENRVLQADNCAEQLRHADGVDAGEVQVMHEAEESYVFYGAYARQYDPKTDKETFKPDPRPDLDLIRSLSIEVTDAAGRSQVVWPFQLATVEALPSEINVASDDWDLARADGVYSLQIGVFYNTDDMTERRRAAEEYCKLLRDEGEPAYFHHGPSNSSVFIGAFPESAIQDVTETDPLSGVVRVKRKIVDKEMLRLQNKYPHNLHNGHIAYDLVRDPKTGEKVRDPHVSFAVRIPRESQDDWGDNRRLGEGVD